MLIRKVTLVTAATATAIAAAAAVLTLGAATGPQAVAAGTSAPDRVAATATASSDASPPGSSAPAQAAVATPAAQGTPAGVPSAPAPAAPTLSAPTLSAPAGVAATPAAPSPGAPQSTAPGAAAPPRASAPAAPGRSSAPPPPPVPGQPQTQVLNAALTGFPSTLTISGQPTEFTAVITNPTATDYPSVAPVFQVVADPCNCADGTLQELDPATGTWRAVTMPEGDGDSPDNAAGSGTAIPAHGSATFHYRLALTDHNATGKAFAMLYAIDTAAHRELALSSTPVGLAAR
ncbi:hypothetical protein ACFYNO_34255 [Kitasatospora sp. NPDC006697]|uniref:hypothetical protein n=1 Tax=Kitasatospora sp. NPDC006697 TaxID=3364020 RepID=UPI00368F451E